MEPRKDVASSSPSLTAQLFGSKDSTSASSSSGIFGSIFGPPSKQVLGRESVRFDGMTRRQDSQSESWKSKHGGPGHEAGSQGVAERDIGSIYHEQRVQPCHLSSSIYYGGQDVYTHPQSSQGSGVKSVYNDVGEDDSGSASRGNWWQGSLYY